MSLSKPSSDILTLKAYAENLNWFKQLFVSKSLLNALKECDAQNPTKEQKDAVINAFNGSTGFFNWIGKKLLEGLRKFAKSDAILAKDPKSVVAPAVITAKASVLPTAKAPVLPTAKDVEVTPAAANITAAATESPVAEPASPSRLNAVANQVSGALLRATESARDFSNAFVAAIKKGRINAELEAFDSEYYTSLEALEVKQAEAFNQLEKNAKTEKKAIKHAANPQKPGIFTSIFALVSPKSTSSLAASNEALDELAKLAQSTPK